jgi:hypothetical protein
MYCCYLCVYCVAGGGKTQIPDSLWYYQFNQMEIHIYSTFSTNMIAGTAITGHYWSKYEISGVCLQELSQK